MRRYGLRDDQWDRIEALLPGREGSVGVTAVDNRRFVEAVLYRYRAGVPWRDLPERFGDWKNVHRRFSRWAESGVWVSNRFQSCPPFRVQLRPPEGPGTVPAEGASGKARGGWHCAQARADGRRDRARHGGLRVRPVA